MFPRYWFHLSWLLTLLLILEDYAEQCGSVPGTRGQHAKWSSVFFGWSVGHQLQGIPGQLEHPDSTLAQTVRWRRFGFYSPRLSLTVFNVCKAVNMCQVSDTILPSGQSNIHLVCRFDRQISILFSVAFGFIFDIVLLCIGPPSTYVWKSKKCVLNKSIHFQVFSKQ